MRILSTVFGSTCLLILAACGGSDPSTKSAPNKTAPPIKAEAFILSPAPFQETLEIPGTLMAAESAEIHPETSGRIVKLNLAEGKLVSKGYLIAKLDDADLQAQLQKLRTQLAIAEKTEARQSKLLSIQGISQQDYDLSLLQVRNLKADIGILQTAMDKTEVRAPFAGKLGLKNISVGAYVNPATTITSLQQSQSLKIDFSLPEKYNNELKLGSTLDFQVSGSATTYQAKISATAPGLNESNRSLNYRATVLHPDSYLLPGAFATLQIRLAEKPQALFIPAQAVIPQARGKKVIRYEQGKSAFVDITIGTRNADQVEVLTGLQAGDTILLSGLMSIRPNSPVQIGKIVNDSLKK
jgi:membrane fusion protein (multidrug efflux system)